MGSYMHNYHSTFSPDKYLTLSATELDVEEIKPEENRAFQVKFEILIKLLRIDDKRAALVERFLDHCISVYDPDAVASFLHWKEDPVLDTILLLTGKLDDEDRYEILDHAEDLAARARVLAPGDSDGEQAGEVAARRRSPQ